LKKNWVIIWVLIIAALFAGAGFLFMRGRALDNSKQANNKPSPTPAFVKGEAPKSPVPADRLQTFDFVTVTVDANGQIKTRETKQGTQYTGMHANSAGVTIHSSGLACFGDTQLH
jgi:hypothetical protein